MYEPLQASFYRYPVEFNELPGIDRMLLVHRSAYTARAGCGAAAESAATRRNRSGACTSRARTWYQFEFEHDDNYHDFEPVGIGSEPARAPSRRMLASVLR
jgi:hypothetical protein